MAIYYKMIRAFLFVGIPGYALGLLTWFAVQWVDVQREKDKTDYYKATIENADRYPGQMQRVPAPAPPKENI